MDAAAPSPLRDRLRLPCLLWGAAGLVLYFLRFGRLWGHLWLVGLLGFLLVLALHASVHGMIGEAGRSGPRGRRLRGIAAQAAPLLLFATAVGWFVLEGTESWASFTGRVARGEFVVPPLDPLKVAPLPPGGDPGLAWRVRATEGAYDAAGLHGPWDAAARRFIAHAAATLEGDLQANDRAALVPEARALDEGGCPDPLVLYLAAWVNDEVPYRDRTLRRAVAGFPGTGYSAFWPLCAAVELNEAAGQMGMRDVFVDQALDGSFRAFSRFLAEAAGDAGARSYLLRRLGRGDLRDYVRHNPDDLLGEVEKAPGLSPAFRQGLAGCLQYLAAWDEIHRAWWEDRLRMGWSGERGALYPAGEALGGAWERGERDPVVAAARIAVEMDEGSPVDRLPRMRARLDDALAAGIDPAPACRAFLWALGPRRGGNDFLRLDFGERCLETGRFDTGVPLLLLESDEAVAADLWRPDNLYRTPARYAALRRMFEGYLAAGDGPFPPAYLHTLYAVVASRARDYAEAHRQLSAVGYRPDPAALAFWRGDYSHLGDRVLAYQAARQADLERAEALHARGDFDRALELYRKAEGAQPDRFLEAYVRGQAAAIGWERELAAGRWATLLPARSLDGWQDSLGRWRLLDDGSLEGKGGVNGMMACALARVGPDFEAEGDFEIAATTNGQFQTGLVFGHPHFGGDGWASFRIKKTAWEGECAYFGEGWSAPNVREIAHARVPLRDHLVVRCYHGSMSADLNGVPVVRDYRLPGSEAFAFPDGVLGVGGFYDQNEVTVRIAGLKVRRLPAPPGL